MEAPHKVGAQKVIAKTGSIILRENWVKKVWTVERNNVGVKKMRELKTCGITNFRDQKIVDWKPLYSGVKIALARGVRKLFAAYTIKQGRVGKTFANFHSMREKYKSA